MRVTLDSNVWEWLFASSADSSHCILAALRSQQISAFICDAALRIEAITKEQRAAYLASAAPFFGPTGVVERDGRPYLHLSLMPDDRRHPGPPRVQTHKLRVAQEYGVTLLRGLSWISLPNPPCSLEYVPETLEQRGQREERQHVVFDGLAKRGVGKAPFDRIIDRIDRLTGRKLTGWSGLDRLAGQERKELARACAEWADAELVAAHVGYGNDLLCTEDRARGAGRSAFATDLRQWLSSQHGVRFVTIAELADLLEAPR